MCACVFLYPLLRQVTHPWTSIFMRTIFVIDIRPPQPLTLTDSNLQTLLSYWNAYLCVFVCVWILYHCQADSQFQLFRLFQIARSLVLSSHRLHPPQRTLRKRTNIWLPDTGAFPNHNPSFISHLYHPPGNADVGFNKMSTFRIDLFRSAPRRTGSGEISRNKMQQSWNFIKLRLADNGLPN